MLWEIRVNARAETLLEKPSFRRPFLTQRCLVPAGGFYEWRKDGKAKQPFLIRRRDKAPIAFAGIWDRWNDPSRSHDLHRLQVVS
jgi:putative SOS response-associated peptidase YedK